MKTIKLILALLLTASPALNAMVTAKEAELDLIKRRAQDTSVHATPARVKRSQASSIANRRSIAGYESAGKLPLVVATSPLETAALAEVHEDLAVMAKLVDDAISSDRRDRSLDYYRAMGIVVDPLPCGSASANLYIEGYGAIVQTSVQFPLAPPKQEETAKPGEKPKSSAWESARRELFGGIDDDTAEAIFLPEHREEYSAERVEAMKQNILKALAHASNFRGLKSDESVTVVVRRRVPGSQFLLLKDSYVSVKPADSPEDAKATMTIRITKSDADALAAGKMDEDEFRKRASVAIY